MRWYPREELGKRQQDEGMSAKVGGTGISRCGPHKDMEPAAVGEGEMGSLSTQAVVGSLDFLGEECKS